MHIYVNFSDYSMFWLYVVVLYVQCSDFSQEHRTPNAALDPPDLKTAVVCCEKYQG